MNSTKQAHAVTTEVPAVRIDRGHEGEVVALHVMVMRGGTFISIWSGNKNTAHFDIDVADWDALIDASIAQRAAYAAEHV